METTTNKSQEIKNKIKETIAEYEHYSSIVETVMESIKELSHHKNPSARIKNLIKEKLGDEYVVYMDLNHCGTLFQFQIWGNGIKYDNSIHICGNNSWFESKGWAETMLEACKISNRRDSIENLRNELLLIDELTTIEDKINDLKQYAKELKTEKLTEHYIPKYSIDAKMRDEAHYWDDVSYTVQKYFPNTFK